MSRFLAAILALESALAWARPFEGLSRRDQVALLYRPQFQFTRDREPLASVGLAWGRREASLRAPGGLKLLPAGEDGVEIPVAAGERVRVRIAESTPAQVRFWAAVRGRGGDAAGAARLVETWRRRGFPAHLFELGGVLGLPGRVLDNRVAVVGLTEHATREEAALEARRIAAKHRARVEVHEELRALPGGVLEIVDERGAVRARVRDLLWVVAAQDGGIEFDGQAYRGTLYATFDAKGLLAVANAVPVEEMLLGLVPAEIYPSAPLEALKAQAVTARGEVLAKIGTRHFADPFRMCARQHCQVYKGLSREHARTTRAVHATRGRVLWGEGGLVDTVYSASCGGHTENNEVVWDSPRNPHLRGRPDGGRTAGNLTKEGTLARFLAGWPDSFCARARVPVNRVRWTRRFTQAEMTALVGRRRDLGAIRAIEVAERGVSGRARAVRVVGERGVLVVERELPIRRLFGDLHSGMFVVRPEPGENGVPGGFLFIGGGWGHGVGMCQTGAIGMAEAGLGYDRILRHYYRGASPRKVY